MMMMMMMMSNDSDDDDDDNWISSFIHSNYILQSTGSSSDDV